ncbi:uncharacterized protein LOC107627198 [Arachis ipaensis]|uniref:uncharacterized protein LOC107627198 n=1 Tax=Arachis ipaensis TaxID=130454 RepID=UPI0007AFE00C|nr:uncharacterized protein LOC107627198 [Arachis ipaensis]
MKGYHPPPVNEDQQLLPLQLIERSSLGRTRRSRPRSISPFQVTSETNRLLSKKNTLKGDETVVLTKECSVIIQSKLPRKMPDPGSFQILCTIGNITFDKALCHLGTSINLMPLSVMKKPQIQKAQPTRIALQMADKSLRQAHGIVENVLVKVGEFFLPADFVILDMG